MAEIQEEPPESSPSAAGPTTPLPPLSLLSISPSPPSPARTEETPAPSPPPTSRTSLQHGMSGTRWNPSQYEHGSSSGGAGPSQVDVAGGPVRDGGDAGFEFPRVNGRRRNVRNLTATVHPLQSEPAESSLQPAAASSYPVFLHVYELPISRPRRFIGQKFFHSGVQVHELEYQYYGHNQRISGVISGLPLHLHGSELMRHRTTISIGRTNEDGGSVTSSVGLMGRGFTGFVFDLFKKNCNHFSDLFCRKLTGNPIPRWINKPLTFGSGLKLGKYLVPVDELHRLLIKNYMDIRLVIAHNHASPPLQGNSAGIASHGMVLSSDEDTAPYNNDNKLDAEEDPAFWAFVENGGDPTGEDEDEDGDGDGGEEGVGEEQP